MRIVKEDEFHSGSRVVGLSVGVVAAAGIFARVDNAVAQPMRSG